jgi:probable rRNA maturation factor
LEAFSEIAFHFEGVTVPGFNDQIFRDWIQKVVHEEGQTPGVLNFVFCNDNYLLELNKKYLNHHTLTDIITFDYAEEMEGLSGDIFISVDRVRDNAEQLEIPFQDELRRVVIHGVLHLLGYKDKTAAQKARMRDKENYYLTLQF